MNRENTKKLLDKYPKIFRQVNLPPTQTAMYWLFECGDGWYRIIDELCSAIQIHVNEEFIEQVEAVQVKEKHGGLRFYVNHGDDYIWDIINKAEHLSYETCEACGSTTNVVQTPGWIMTRCKSCLGRDV